MFYLFSCCHTSESFPQGSTQKRAHSRWIRFTLLCPPLSLEPALTFQSSATQIVFAPHCFLFPNSTGGKVDFENYFKAKGKVNPESGSRVGFHSQSRFSKKIIFFLNTKLESDAEVRHNSKGNLSETSVVFVTTERNSDPMILHILTFWPIHQEARHGLSFETQICTLSLERCSDFFYLQSRLYS